MNVRSLSAGWMGRNSRYPWKDTLNGEPFPPDDVQAFWSLVPVLITVEWSATLGIFFVTRHAHNDRGDADVQPAIRRQIMASDATKLAVWQRVISELIDEYSA